MKRKRTAVNSITREKETDGARHGRRLSFGRARARSASRVAGRRGTGRARLAGRVEVAAGVVHVARQLDIAQGHARLDPRGAGRPDPSLLGVPALRRERGKGRREKRRLRGRGRGRLAWDQGAAAGTRSRAPAARVRGRGRGRLGVLGRVGQIRLGLGFFFLFFSISFSNFEIHI